MQLPVRRNSLNSGDVFILVCGEDKVWLWIGSNANSDEWAKGSEVAMAFCKGRDVPVLEQGSNYGEVETVDFWGYLPGKVTANPNERGVGPEVLAPSIPGRRDRPCGRRGPLQQGAGVCELILINVSKNYS